MSLSPSPRVPRSRGCGSRRKSPDLGQFNPKVPARFGTPGGGNSRERGGGTGVASPRAVPPAPVRILGVPWGSGAAGAAGSGPTGASEPPPFPGVRSSRSILGIPRDPLVPRVRFRPRHELRVQPLPGAAPVPQVSPGRTGSYRSPVPGPRGGGAEPLRCPGSGLGSGPAPPRARSRFPRGSTGAGGVRYRRNPPRTRSGSPGAGGVRYPRSRRYRSNRSPGLHGGGDRGDGDRRDTGDGGDTRPGCAWRERDVKRMRKGDTDPG